MLQEIKTFLFRNWWHLILFIPGAYAITFLHELAHAIPVWLQGGEVVEFVWYGGNTEYWGHISYTFPENIEYNSFIISIAPYTLAFMIFVITFLVSLNVKSINYIFASCVFIWLIVVPLAEIAYALFPYNLYGKKNDLMYAFGEPTFTVSIFTFGLTVIGVLFAYIAHKKLFHPKVLSFKSFIFLSSIPILILSLPY